MAGLVEARSEGRRKSLGHLEIKRTANGGHLVTHHYIGGTGYPEPQHYSFGGGQGTEVLAHIAKHLGISELEGEKHGAGQYKQGQHETEDEEDRQERVEHNEY